MRRQADNTFKSIVARIYVIASSIDLYHGGDLDNLKKLKKSFSILTPDEKRSVPSTGGDKIGLSSSTDKNIALQYSRVFGTNRLIKFTLASDAKIYDIDSKGKGIDEVLSNDEIVVIQKDWDAIRDVGCHEKEYRILKNRHVQQVKLV